MKTISLLCVLVIMGLYTGRTQAQCTPPAAPVVNGTVTYCQNATATALTATGTNLQWGNPVQGSVGGTNTLANTTYIDGSYNNKKVNFTTTVANVTLKTVDYYIPAWQAVNGLVLSIYNNAGTVIATSSTTTTSSGGSSGIKITSTFNYNIAAAGNYSIGVSSGVGNIGSDNPSFPISEGSGTISVTGVSVPGARCFNNIVFAKTASATAPVPSTATVGTTAYYVTQTIAGCTSLPATINVVVNAAPAISQVPVANLIASYKMEGNANDATGNNPGTLQNAPSATADRYGQTGKAISFNGTSQYISTAESDANPGHFTVSIWFKTNTVTGGRLIGFGTAQTGSSGQYDRHIYMANNGQIFFGVYPNTVKTINSTASYNDNNWHLATATLSSTSGMVLYVDGAQVAADGTTTSAENYTGYWRIGYDNNSGWTSQPNNFYFSGMLDDALIYDRALTPAEISTLYKSPGGASNNGPVCSGSTLSLSAVSVSGATYAWTGPNGFTSSQQNPALSYTAAAAGTYTLQVSAAGCISTAYTNVTSSTNTGQWTGNVSTNWSDAGNWCNAAIPTAATNVVIAAGAIRMPSISSNASCNNITIQSGAALTTTAAGTLNISGLLANSGTMVNAGTTNFNGTTQQTFSGINTFHNLTITNSAGVVLPAATIVNNNLTIASGTLTTNNFALSVAGNWINNASVSALVYGTATVTLNGSAAQTIGGTVATNFNHLTVANTGNTVTLQANVNIVGNLSVNSGTFNLSTFTANRTTAGGILTVANNAVLQIGGTNTFPSNYATNTLVVASTVEYSGTNQAISNKAYGNLKLSSSAGAAVKTFPATALSILGNLITTVGSGTSVSFTAASNITLSGNIAIGTGVTFNGGSFAHSMGGNWVNDGVFNGNTGTISFMGPGSVISGAGTQNFNNVTVGVSQVSFSNANISLTGNLATTGSGSFIQAAGGTLLMTGSAKTISGSGISINNLNISGSVSTTASFGIAGNLSVSGSLNATGGTITLSGSSKLISGIGTKNFGSSTTPH